MKNNEKITHKIYEYVTRYKGKKCHVHDILAECSYRKMVEAAVCVLQACGVW